MEGFRRAGHLFIITNIHTYISHTMNWNQALEHIKSYYLNNAIECASTYICQHNSGISFSLVRSI